MFTGLEKKVSRAGIDICSLVFKDSSYSPIVLGNPTYTIGRQGSNQILLKNPKISRRHGWLKSIFVPETGQNTYEVYDGEKDGKRSTCGIYVNGRRIYRHILSNNDEISFGGVVEAIYLQSTPSGTMVSDFETVTIAKRIGETLLDAGLVSIEQLQKALFEQSLNKQRLGTILAQHGWVKQQTIDFLIDNLPVIKKQVEKKPIGQYFKAAGLLDEPQIQEILKEQKLNMLRFGSLAVLKGYINQKTLNYFLEALVPPENRESYLRKKKPEVQLQNSNSNFIIENFQLELASQDKAELQDLSDYIE